MFICCFRPVVLYSEDAMNIFGMEIVMYIKGKFVSGQELDEVNEVRNSCGLVSEDSDDGMAIHVVAYCVDEETKPVATGRLRFDGDEYTVDLLCCRPEETEDYTDFVLKMLIYQAVQHGAKQITGLCELTQVALYKRNRFTLVEENGNKCIMKLENAAVHHCCN